MFKKVYGFVKDIFTSDLTEMMVVNGSYYRPMTKKADNASLRGLSDDKYLEICEQFRHR